MGVTQYSDYPQAAVRLPKVGSYVHLDLERIVALQPDLFILDELFSGLSLAEVASIVPIIEKLRFQGKTIIMIEHVMKAVQALADQLLVLHNGQRIAEGPPAQVLRDERVIEVYLGGKHRERISGSNGGGV